MSARNTMVTAGLVTGDRVGGLLQQFDEDVGLMRLLVAGAQGGKAPLQLPLTSVVWVGFHRRAGELVADVGGFAELKMHAPAGHSFVVRVDPAAMRGNKGFMAVPSDPSSPFGRMWFARSRLLAVEQTGPLGQHLVEGGEAQRKTVVAALNQQQHKRRLRLGKLLVEEGLIAAEELQAALQRQKERRGQPLGQMLIEMGAVTEQAVMAALGRKFHLPVHDLDVMQPDPEARAVLSGDLIARHRVLPVAVSDDELTVAIDNPLALDAIEAARFPADRPVREVLVTPSQLRAWLGEIEVSEQPAQRTGEDFEGILRDLERQATVDSDPAAALEDDPDRDSGDLGIVGLVNRVIIDAYEMGASDIHVEPGGVDHPCLIRMRVDGACEHYREIPQRYARAVVSRIKIMSRLDIAERRKPQDGKIRFRVPPVDIELRVATVPTVGEQETW